MQKQVIEFKITPEIDNRLSIDELIEKHVEDLRRSLRNNNDMISYMDEIKRSILYNNR